MSQPLPTGGLKWVSIEPSKISQLAKRKSEGYLLEVDVKVGRDKVGTGIDYHSLLVLFIPDIFTQYRIPHIVFYDPFQPYLLIKRCGV